MVQNSRQWFDQHLRRTGLPRIRLHDLRHSYATLALTAGEHPKVVSERLGHATVAITLDTPTSHVHTRGGGEEGGGAARRPGGL
jgi:integrase